MSPSSEQIQALWDTYRLPPYKRNHSLLVARTALWLAAQLKARDPGVRIDANLLEAAALLHDIDKMAPKLPGERHPDAGVRILREHGFSEVADIVRTHPLHAILDQSIAPSTAEERILYLADKMVKHAIITVDERFALWRAEHLPEDAVKVLDASYPRVKALEREVLGAIGVAPENVAGLANGSDLSTMKLS